MPPKCVLNGLLKYQGNFIRVLFSSLWLFCATDVFLQDQKNCNIQVESKPLKAPRMSPLSRHSGQRCCAVIRHASQNPTAAEAFKGKRSRGRKHVFCRCGLQLYLNSFFNFIIFSFRLQTLRTLETARERGGYVIQSTANAKEVFRTIGGYVWREGRERKQSGAEGGGLGASKGVIFASLQETKDDAK